MVLNMQQQIDDVIKGQMGSYFDTVNHDGYEGSCTLYSLKSQ